MNQRQMLRVLPCALLVAILPGHASSRPGSNAQADGWIENVGQWPAYITFATRSGNSGAYADREGLWIRRTQDGQSNALRLVWGRAASVRVEGLDPLPGVTNFYLGDDRARWREGVRRFDSIRWCGVEDGIDVVARETPAGIKYDVHVARSADLARLVVRCEGLDGIALGSDGDLEAVGAPGLELVQRPGLAWEELPGGARRTVEVVLVARGASSFGWACPSCDPNLPLVIDPELVWATYLGASSSPGGPGDLAYDCKVSPQGRVLATGRAGTPDFPATPGAFQSSVPSSFLGAFLTCFEPDGQLRWSSVFGAPVNNDGPNSLAVDPAGHAYVVGLTSLGWPTTPGAFDEQLEFPGAAAYAMSFDGDQGALRYSTYLHHLDAQGTGTIAYSVTVDASGAATIGGRTSSSFPTTPGAYERIGSPPLDAFLCRLDPTGSRLVWATLLGGTGLKDEIWAIAIDHDGTVVFAGQTGSRDLPTTLASYQPEMGQHSYERSCVGRLSADGSQLLWITYLSFGGPSYGEEFVRGLGLDGAGNPIVVGTTTATWFPTTPGAFQTQHSNGINLLSMGDAFLTRLDRDGTRALYSTFFRSGWPESCTDVEVDASGVATVCGLTGAQLPITSGCFDPTHNGDSDGFVARFDPSGSRLLYATMIGGSYIDDLLGLGVTPAGRVSAAGTSYGPDFPTTPNAFAPSNVGGSDAVVVTMELHPEGVRSLGSGTPSCQGVVRSGVLSEPRAHQRGFGIWCSQAPPGGRGWLVLATASLPTPASVGGAQFWLDRSAVRRVIPVTADRLGWAEAPVDLSHVTAGMRVYSQFIFRDTPGCGALAQVSTSAALEIVVH